MLKKLFGKMLNKNKKGKITLNRCHYPLDIQGTAAETVLNRLRRAGYEAYLVGGAIRDFLTGVEPKDFDVATNATPEQVRKVFRRSRIIGRRFPIVHAMIGAEVIEISTFRSGVSVHQNEQGRIMRDTQYGTIEQDVMRRDFTCNALYYDHVSQEIIDFHHGIEDIQAKRLVMIGDPESRYHEDPVRILRALRLAGKLGFEIDEKTKAPIRGNCLRLESEPVARLFDEILKILLSGYSVSCLKMLTLLGKEAKQIHPLLEVMQKAAEAETGDMILTALQQTDERIRNGNHVSNGFILATLWWHQVEHLWLKKQGSGASPGAAMTQAIAEVCTKLEKGWGVPQRYTGTMREIWLFQPQFAYCRGARPFRLVAQKRFRAAYDFMLLRAASNEDLLPLAQWWRSFYAADEIERQELVKSDAVNAFVHENVVKKKKRRRPKKRKVKANAEVA